MPRRRKGPDRARVWEFDTLAVVGELIAVSRAQLCVLERGQPHDKPILLSPSIVLSGAAACRTAVGLAFIWVPSWQCNKEPVSTSSWRCCSNVLLRDDDGDGGGGGDGVDGDGHE